ncbi:MAG: HAMP domain-containing sensor histidine kinase [Gammaproteobacteria bacterium]|nr:HAMP domain-containing sensor histidine kinase [Gammaproteobacteria bacterium]
MPAVLHSLSARLALLLAAMFVLVGIFFVLVMASMTDGYQQEVAQKLNRDLAEQMVAERLLLRDGRVDREGLEHIFHMLMVINPAIEVYLLDSAGHILAFSAPPGEVKREAVDLAPVHAFLGGTRSLPIRGDDPRSRSGRKVFSAAPVEQGSELQGYLYVVLGGQSYENIVDMLRGSYVLKLAAAVVVAGLVFALLLAMLLFTVLTRRLRLLARAIDAFRKTGLVPALAPAARHGDEIDQLRASFEDMAARITGQMERLQENDRLRRAMVANVSHDLRTPLASLQSHLETLRIKESELGGEEKRRYLEIALQNITRLNTLVYELFELAKLDANEVTPECEPFALPELVQDVVQKFELRAEQEGIDLVQDIASTTIPFVVADIGLIERVLDNLLDNALHHTPAGGQVTVSLTPARDHVTVQVRDTGQGIAEHDLPYVFERFYKGSRNPRSQGGAGLGLAIVQRILALHGSVIQATSQSDAGTAFTFDLPSRRPV